MSQKTSIAELAALLNESYSHLELGTVNDHAVYVMNFQGEYPFHSHAQDEFYLVLEGEIFVRFKDKPAEVLKKGECLSVPAYTSHLSGSEQGALVLMVKPKGMFPNPSDLE